MQKIASLAFALMGAILLMGAGRPAAAAGHPYSEGPVSDIAAIRTADGKFEEYMAWLAGPWKEFMEAQKAAGVITGYAVYMAYPHNPNEPDLYLQVTYKNMAALDDFNAKVDPIAEKVFGPMQKADAEQAARSSIRTVLGEELIRELKLK